MPVYTFELTIKQDGQDVPGFPIVKRIQTTEAQIIQTQKAGSDGAGSYVVVPGCSTSASLQGLAIASDQAVNIRLNGQSTGSIALNAGGIVVVIDGLINAGASTNATINNTGSASANLTGFWAGT